MIALEKLGAVAELPLNETPWALENLPPFPAVATRLLSALAKEDVDIREIVKIVAAEPVFATRVLQMANSSLFATQQHVRGIPQAIILVGLERVRAITVTRAMGDFIAPAINLKTLRACWQNSLAGAILAGKLARACGMETFSYVAGLVRDIGRLALLMKYPGAYANLVAVSREQKFDLTATERELFDLDHCEAGARLMQTMPLPAELCEVVARHHESEIEGRFRMVHLVRCADRMADALGFAVVAPCEALDFAAVCEEFAACSGARFDKDPEELKMEIMFKLVAWA